MEAISNGVEDFLIDGLSFKLPAGSSYVSDRRKCTFWATGSNIYKPKQGTRVMRFLINGESGTWLDPDSVRIQFTVENESGAGKNLRPLGGGHLFIRRMRLLANNVLCEDILDYGRFHQMIESMYNNNVRENIDIENFGYRFDDKYNKDCWMLDSSATDGNTTEQHIKKRYLKAMPGIQPFSSHTVSFKLMSGLLGMSNKKYIPLKACPLILELEIVGDNDECVVSPDSYINDGNNDAFTTVNTGTEWSINNCCVKLDLITLDAQLDNSYTSHLLEGRALPLQYTTFINQQSAIVGNTFSVQVARAVSRLKQCFISFWR